MEILVLLFVLAAVIGAVVLVFWIASSIVKRRHAAWARVAAQLGLTFREDYVFGILDGQPVKLWTEVRGSGKSSQRYTIVSSALVMPLDLGLGLAKQGFLDDAFSGLFGSEDHLVGDREFDRAVIVRADEPDRVRALLSPAIPDPGAFNGLCIDDSCRLRVCAP